MSTDDGAAAGLQGKVAAPTLNARAPRPAAIRIRRSTIIIVGVAAASLVAAALAWSLIIQPELRMRARAQTEKIEDSTRGEARPSEAVTLQPASYDRLAPQALPEPRRLNDRAAAVGNRTITQEARPRPQAVRLDHSGIARAAGLFFDRSQPFAAEPRGANAPAPEHETTAPAAASAAPPALAPPRSPFEVKAGAVISASLLTGVDTGRPSPIVATVTHTVFDTVSGRHCLIPAGARLIGRQEGASRYGERRAFMTFERLILPDGRSIGLSGASGVDAEGVAGVRGRADRRLVPLGVASIFAGAVTALGELARDNDEEGGLLGDAGDAAAIEAAQVGSRLIDRELQVAPTIRLAPGAQMRVLITEDLVLEPCP